MAVALLASIAAAGCSFAIRGISPGDDPAAQQQDGGAAASGDRPGDDLAAAPDLLAPPDLVPPEPELVGNAAATGPLTNLTLEGALDWAHYGHSSAEDVNRKLGGGNLISPFATLKNSTPTRYTDNLVAFRWTDGAPTASELSTKTGVYVGGIDDGFAVSAPADTTEHTLAVYVGGYLSSGTLRAHLSDASAEDYINASFQNLVGSYVGTFWLRYRAKSAGQTLLVIWKQTSLGGNVTLQATALK